ncbi:uncharacterized protein LOC115625504 [Scaptodrosophila lebanonensis]|uniref:Uncharacterized protein LOC115625504 n=1 Tax=Drosophila lebanonensis TaxID=7225 RepID=A0A6J2TLP0_DROLE|nr:uncharacterized protein LOC115625504 [Scaptodrosophila lebanonensis]
MFPKKTQAKKFNSVPETNPGVSSREFIGIPDREFTATTAVADADKAREQDQQALLAPTEEPPVTAINLVQVIRREINDILTGGSFKHDLAEEMLLLNNSQQVGESNESMAQRLLQQTNYVKLDDLKDIVDKLISRNVVQSALSNYNTKFAETIKILKDHGEHQAEIHKQTMLKLQDQLDMLRGRIDTLEHVTHQMQKFNIDKQVERAVQELGLAIAPTSSATKQGVKPPPPPPPMQQSSAKIKAKPKSRSAVALPRSRKTSVVHLPPPSTFQSSDTESENLVVPSAAQNVMQQEDKIRAYDELIRKYDRQMTLVSSSGTITQTRLTPSITGLLDAAQTKATVPTVAPKRHEEQPLDTARREQSAHDRQQRDKFERHAAEQRLFETNLLMYHKSPFTMQLNSRKDSFPNALRDQLMVPQQPQRRARAPGGSASQRSTSTQSARQGMQRHRPSQSHQSSVQQQRYPRPSDGSSDWLFEQ